MQRLEHAPWPFLLLPILAFWPVWQWMAQRTLDRSDDAWGLLSLATAALFLWQHGHPRRLANRDLLLPVALTLLYLATYAVLPPLLRAGLALSIIAACASTACFGTRMHGALWGLLLLSLPVMASLNFYLGYPLRVVTGAASATLLNLNGFAVIRDGALLVWNGHTIAVDAPCSGIKMLWTGAYLCCTLAAFHSLTALRTLGLCGLGFLIVLAANILRASALFYIETDLLGLPKTWHDGVGVTVFVLTAASLTLLAQAIQGKPHAP